MKKCPFCNADIEENARFCLYCMTPLEEKQPAVVIKPTHRWWLYVIAAVLVVAATVLAVLLLNGSDEIAVSLDNSSSEVTSSDAVSSEPITENGDQSEEDEDLPLNNYQPPTDTSSDETPSENTVTNQPATEDTPSTEDTTETDSTTETDNTTETDTTSSSEPTDSSTDDLIIPSFKYKVFTLKGVNGEVVITKCDTSAEGEIIIPNKVNGYKVTGIADEAFKDCAGITHIEMSGSIKTIGNNAFEGCASLLRVQFPVENNLSHLGSYAFKNCSALNSSNLLYLKISYVPEGLFYNCPNLDYVVFPKTAVTIEKCVAYGCGKLHSVTLPANAELEVIKEDAFFGCDSIESVYYLIGLNREELIIEKGNEGLGYAEWEGIRFVF